MIYYLTIACLETREPGPGKPGLLFNILPLGIREERVVLPPAMPHSETRFCYGARNSPRAEFQKTRLQAHKTHCYRQRVYQTSKQDEVPQGYSSRMTNNWRLMRPAGTLEAEANCVLTAPCKGGPLTLTAPVAYGRC